MSRSSTVLAVLALIAVCFSFAAALKCKKCIPTDKIDCKNEADYTDETCSAAEPYCRRMIQNVAGKTSLVLQCGADPAGLKKEYYNTANDYVKANVYHCYEKDFCNSASDFGVSKLAAIAVVALAWMLH